MVRLMVKVEAFTDEDGNAYPDLVPQDLIDALVTWMPSAGEIDWTKILMRGSGGGPELIAILPDDADAA